jgi:hypothetical protein
MGWKRHKGILGPLKPLQGRWIAEAMSMPDGSTGDCSRDFQPSGAGFMRLEAMRNIGARGVYREIAVFGEGDDGTLAFWSFTIDGKRSIGRLCDATDVHRDAVAFEAEMPAGVARSVYWPDDDNDDGFCFAVESRLKKGWNRFLHHRYRRA